MLIFLYGTDDYRSRQKLKEIIAHYKKIRKQKLNLEYLNSQDLNFQDFRDKIQQRSIFKEKKLIILFNFFLNIELKKRFLEEEKKDNFLTKIEDIILFYEERGVSKEDPFFIFLKKQASSQEFKLLEGQKLKNWARKEFSNYQIEISSKALEQLINFVGNNLWQMSNEIKKLTSYKPGQKVEVKDIELLVKPKIEIDIFKTIDAIALKNKKRALFLIHKHLERGDNPLYLLSMINFQFRNLLIIKDGGKIQLHPYVIKKSYSQAQKFTIDELKKIYQKIFQADLDIKTGRVNPIVALDMLITEI